MSDSQDVLLRQLQQLKELRDSGALTQEGFERRAADLLSGSSEGSGPSSSEEVGSGGPGDWSATPKPREGSHPWEAKPTRGGGGRTTPIATVTAEAPANAGGEKAVARSMTEVSVQPGTTPASHWSAAPRVRGLSESETSAERKIPRRDEPEDTPVVPEAEPSAIESETSEGAASESPSVICGVPAPVDQVSTKERRRWLRRRPNSVAPAEGQQAAAHLAVGVADSRREDAANEDEGTVGDIAKPEVAAAAEPLPQPDLGSASMAVSEAAPDSAATGAELAVERKEEAKEKQSWWRRGLSDLGAVVEAQRAASTDDATSEEELQRRPEPDAGPGGAVPEEVEPPELEQPFQRDLRWRRQSFLPAKWDEVRQGDRKGSYWDSSSRVVPSPPEADIDQDKGQEKKPKQKSTYWARNRKGD